MATPLFDPLTFSPEQAAMLKNTPGQSLSATNTFEQLKAAGANVDVASISPTNPVGIKNPSMTNMGDAMVAGAKTGVEGYNKYLELLQGGDKTATATEADTLRSEISGDLEGLAGRGAAQLDAEREAGVNDLRNELAGLNAQILSRTAEYDKLSTQLEGRPITMASIIGGEAQIRKAKASEIGLLNALALGKQGQLSAAQDAADRAVDLAYEDRETQIDIRMKQLELLQPTLDAEERQRSQALELYLTDQKEALADQKAEAKGFQNDKLNAIMDGMSVAVAQQAQSLFDSGKIDEAYSLIGRYSGSGSGSGTFTQTQLNQGAAVAGISINDFGRLDSDTKNFFINRKTDIADQKKAIDDAKELGENPFEIESIIQEMDIPESVKDTLVRYLQDVFADEYAAGNAPTESDSGPWWKFW